MTRLTSRTIIPLLFLCASISGGDFLINIAEAQPAQSQPITQTEPKSIILHVGQSEVVRAPWPVKRTNLTDTKVAEAEPLTADQILLQGRGIGTTDLILWSAQEEIWRARIDVEMDLRRLKEQMQKLFLGSNIELIQNQNVIVITGSLRRAEDTIAMHQFLEAMKLSYVDATRVSGVQQVLLQVRVAEANRTALRVLGINAFYTGTQDGTFFGASTVGPANGGNINALQFAPASNSLIANEAVPVPYVTNNNVAVSPLVTMSLGFPRAELYFLLQALAENQYLQLLAEPNLVAQSGEEATFLAGGEFPIPIVQGNTTGGGTSITVEYKEFGVRLKFKPIVLGDNLIRLTVAPEVSDLSEVGAVILQGFSIPALNTRRASTTLELHSGETFSMAGLINRATGAISSKTPGLGELPVLGALFRSMRYKEGETEMIVLVTATLIDPLAMKSLPPLPGQTHRRPNDWELYLGGAIEGSGPMKISDEEANWLRKLGFDNLRGPGAWAEYGETPPENSSNSKSTATAQNPMNQAEGTSH